MANLRRLPPGTLPPVVLKSDASSLPVCLVTFKGKGLTRRNFATSRSSRSETNSPVCPVLRCRHHSAGKYRQIMVYADPYKLEAHQLSLMDVVRSINDANLILPAGDVQIGPWDYSLYTNSQLRSIEDIANLPVKVVGNSPVRVSDIGEAKDSSQIQTNIVRVDGQRSVYIPVLKQGGDTNTIAVVDGVKAGVEKLFDVPEQLITNVVFDQSKFVKTAIETLLHEGGIGLFLTSLMILVFLGSMRATVAVFFSIPLSALATFLLLSLAGSSINSMILGGLALAFSRLIDNSVVVLENIYRHLELGESPEVAAETRRARGGATGSGGHADNRDRVFPGDPPLWSQPVSLLRPGTGSGDLAVCLLCSCPHCSAVVLRPLHQVASACDARFRRRRSPEEPARFVRTAL